MDITPERLRQIIPLLESALELDSSQRRAYLDRACGGDEALRRDIEAMIAAQHSADKIFDRPPVETILELFAHSPTPQMSNDADAETADVSRPLRSQSTYRQPSLLPPGAIVGGRYRIEGELGHGGFGTVMLARDGKVHGARVVVKVLRYYETGDHSSLEPVKKFRDEAKALSKMNHPGIVRVQDLGDLPDGRPYLVMEYIPGKPLRAAITSQGMELRRVAELIRQIATALTAVHEQNIIHGDLKPENIMLQELGNDEYQVKIVDFGTSKDMRPQTVASGIIAGTPGYMASEQINGKPSVSTDIFAMGVIAYEMLTGRRPFKSVRLLGPASIFELLDELRAGVKERPKKLRREIPKKAEDAVLKALSYDPKERQERVSDFGHELAQALTANLESPVWLVFSAFCYVITFILGIVISNRFLRSEPDILSFLVASLIWLMLLVVGITFTRTGLPRAEAIASRFGIKSGYESNLRAAFVSISLLMLTGLYFSLPTIAGAYNEKAIQLQPHHDAKKEIGLYLRAISLFPDFAQAHYNLACTYEDVRDYDSAVAEYQTAIRADPEFYFAYNNLARLHLARRNDCASALNTINKAFEQNPREPEILYSLYKNRGWSHYCLQTYDLAISDLNEAIKLYPERAAAYCLLAQVSESLDQPQEALIYWPFCLGYSPGQEDELEDAWLSKARERLRQGDAK